MEDDKKATGNRIFDELRDLHEISPERFEKRRRQLIEEAIDRVPASRRQRALGWQFRLEACLRPYRDPVARMNKMVEILWGQIETLRQAMNGTLAGQGRRGRRRQVGKIVPFPPSDNRH